MNNVDVNGIINRESLNSQDVIDVLTSRVDQLMREAVVRDALIVKFSRELELLRTTEGNPNA